jgi:hypothetical protein
VDLADKPTVWAMSDKDGFAFFLILPKDYSPYWHWNLRDQRDPWRFALNVYRYASRGRPIRPRTTD